MRYDSETNRPANCGRATFLSSNLGRERIAQGLTSAGRSQTRRLRATARRTALRSLLDAEDRALGSRIGAAGDYATRGIKADNHRIAAARPIVEHGNLVAARL